MDTKHSKSLLWSISGRVSNYRLDPSGSNPIPGTPHCVLQLFTQHLRWPVQGFYSCATRTIWPESFLSVNLVRICFLVVNQLESKSLRMCQWLGILRYKPRLHRNRISGIKFPRHWMYLFYFTAHPNLPSVVVIVASFVLRNISLSLYGTSQSSE